MKQNVTIIICFLFLALAFASEGGAVTIVDTGSPLNDGHGYLLYTPQWLAGEFSIDNSYTVTDIHGFIMDN